MEEVLVACLFQKVLMLWKGSLPTKCSFYEDGVPLPLFLSFSKMHKKEDSKFCLLWMRPAHPAFLPEGGGKKKVFERAQRQVCRHRENPEDPTPRSCGGGKRGSSTQCLQAGSYRRQMQQ